MDSRVRVQRGTQPSFRFGEMARGVRCAASGAFDGSSPTANLVSVIKVQGPGPIPALAEVGPRRRTTLPRFGVKAN